MYLCILIQAFSVPWPSELRGIITFFAIADFDIDVLKPECVMDWNYYTATTFNLCLPLIFAFFSGLHVLLGFLWSRFVAKRQIYGIRLPFMQAEAERWRDFARERLSSLLSILVILYNELCKSSFQSFACAQLPDGKSFLYAEPTVECYTTEHIVLMVGSVLAIAVYVIGIPAYFGWKLYWLMALL